jgi:hypothetical protein
MGDKTAPQLRDIIVGYPSAEVKVIVEASDDPKQLESLVNSRNGVFLGQSMRYAAVRIEASHLETLAKEPEVAKIWYVDSRIFDAYFNIIKAAEYMLSHKSGEPKIVNMSLGPPIDRSGTLRFDPEEPVNVATKALYDAGKVVVMAVGNSGDLGDDTLNPWSVAPWVIGVGAATKDGKKLADFSSRGIPGDPLYKPTVVAPGIDVVTTHPAGIKKTPEQLAKDKQFISEDKLDRYTVVSGTSFATADVSGAVAQIVGFISWLESNKSLGNQLMEISVSINGYRKNIRFKVNTQPSNIKNFVTQFAMHMPKHQPHEVGAGFISQAMTQQCFGEYASKPKIMPIKIV